MLCICSALLCRGSILSREGRQQWEGGFTEHRSEREIARNREEDVGDPPSSHFLQCCAWASVFSEGGRQRERQREWEREAPAICATGNSTAIAHPHLLLLLSAFFSPSLSFLLLPWRLPFFPDLPNLGLERLDFLLYDFWMVAEGDGGLKKGTEAATARGKEILITSRGIPSLTTVARDPW